MRLLKIGIVIILSILAITVEAANSSATINTVIFSDGDSNAVNSAATWLIISESINMTDPTDRITTNSSVPIPSQQIVPPQMGRYIKIISANGVSFKDCSNLKDILNNESYSQIILANNKCEAGN